VTCGRDGNGHAFCWGTGALGNGTTRDSARVPVPVAGGLVFRSLAVNGEFTCGVTDTLATFCWGDGALGEHGQLGNDSAVGYSQPSVPVPGVTLSSVVVGQVHSCGLAAGGAAYCWGENLYGETGSGAVGGQFHTPVAVAGGISFVSLSSGSGWTNHTCGITATGAAYCWGMNNRGQLGIGRSGLVQCAAGGIYSGAPCGATPAPVTGGSAFGSISVGGDHTCAVTFDHVGYCWGENVHGALGTGSSGDTSYIPVPVSGGLKFLSISAGLLHTCGLTTAHAAYCWGVNDYHALGTNTPGTSSAIPVPVETEVLFVAISSGFNHTCAITAAGAAYCWGAMLCGTTPDSYTCESDDFDGPAASLRRDAVHRGS